MANKNLYEILGVDKNADEKEIKKAFRAKAKYWHPDRWGDKSSSEQKNAEEKFKEVTEAYDILSDKDKKAQYDMFGTTDFSNGGYSSSSNVDDIMAEFMKEHAFGGFGHFGGFSGFGGFGHNREKVYKGTDRKIKVSVSIEDVFFSRKKTFSYEVQRPCSDCNGKGSKSGVETTCPYCHGSGMITETKMFGVGRMMQQSSPCPHCQGSGMFVKDPCHKCSGTGLVSKRVEKTLQVPKVDNLSYAYQIVGEGNSCQNGRGTNGDLFIMFAIKEDNTSRFYLDKNNLRNIMTDIEVSAIDCMTGCTKEVLTVDGKKLRLNIPQGTKDGHKFEFYNYGFETANGQIGSLIANLKMTMPKLTKNQADKIKEILKEK